MDSISSSVNGAAAKSNSLIEFMGGILVGMRGVYDHTLGNMFVGSEFINLATGRKTNDAYGRRKFNELVQEHPTKLLTYPMRIAGSRGKASHMIL